MLALADTGSRENPSCDDDPGKLNNRLGLFWHNGSSLMFW